MPTVYEQFAELHKQVTDFSDRVEAMAMRRRREVGVNVARVTRGTLGVNAVRTYFFTLMLPRKSPFMLQAIAQDSGEGLSPFSLRTYDGLQAIASLSVRGTTQLLCSVEHPEPVPDKSEPFVGTTNLERDREIDQLNDDHRASFETLTDMVTRRLDAMQAMVKGQPPVTALKDHHVHLAVIK